MLLTYQIERICLARWFFRTMSRLWPVWRRSISSTLPISASFRSPFCLTSNQTSNSWRACWSKTHTCSTASSWSKKAKTCTREGKFIRGIHFLSKRSFSELLSFYDQPLGRKLQVNTSLIVQKILDEPLLIGGHKADLRWYLAVLSVEPLIYKAFPGFFRLAKDKYVKGRCKRSIQLTNTSVNTGKKRNYVAFE